MTNQLMITNPTPMELLILMDIAYQLDRENKLTCFMDDDDGIYDTCWIQDELEFDGNTVRIITFDDDDEMNKAIGYAPTDEFADYADKMCSGDTINDNINRPPC